MNFIWGASYSVTKWILLSIQPATLATFRFTIGGFILFLLAEKREESLDRNDWIRVLGVGFFGITLAFLAHLHGIRLTTATKAAIEISLEPAIILLLSVVFLKEPFKLRTLAALGISMAGAWMLVAGNMSVEQLFREFSNGGQILGDILTIISVFLAGVYTIMIKPLAQKLGSIRAASYGCLTGSALLVPLSVMENYQGFVLPLTVNFYVALVFLSLVCTAFGYSLWNVALTEIPAAEMAITLNIQPLAGILVGAWFLNETLPWTGVFGTVLILLGVSMTSETKTV